MNGHRQLCHFIITTAIVTLTHFSAIAETLFISAAGLDQVHRFEVTPTSGPTQTATLSTNLSRPQQLDLNSTGELFVANHTETAGMGSVARFLDPLGTLMPNGVIADDNGDPGFNFGTPHGLRFIDDEMFVVNSGGDNVLRFEFDGSGTASSSGIITSGINQGLRRARWAAVSPWGELFVSECCQPNEINRYRFDGVGNAIFNGTISGVDNPHGMAFSASGEMFVANAGSFPTPSVGSVGRFTFTSQDINGLAVSNGLITGNGLGTPLDLAFAPWGELFVTNTIISVGTGGVSRFTFDSLGNAQANGRFGDGVDYSGILFVPEPSTVGLAFLGGGLMLLTRKRTGLLLGVLTCVVALDSAQQVAHATLIASDTYTRANSTNLGTTETGGFDYQEFNGSGGFLNAADIAEISGNEARFTGGALGNTPSLARLSAVGFDVDLTATIRMEATDYTANSVSNAPELSLRHGLDFPGSQVTQGSIRLIIRPDSTHRISVTTASGTFVGDPNYQFVDLVDQAPIGPAFLATDGDNDGVLEVDEPFTLRAVVHDDQFVWFMNGSQIGPVWTLPSAAVAGVDQSVASNLLIGRTRIAGGPSELEVAWDDLAVSVSQPIPEPSSAALTIISVLFALRAIRENT